MRTFLLSPLALNPSSQKPDRSFLLTTILSHDHWYVKIPPTICLVKLDKTYIL